MFNKGETMLGPNNINSDNNATSPLSQDTGNNSHTVNPQNQPIVSAQDYFSPINQNATDQSVSSKFTQLKNRFKAKIANAIKPQIDRIKSLNILHKSQEILTMVKDKISDLKTHHKTDKFVQLLTDSQAYLTEDEEMKMTEALVGVISNVSMDKNLKQQTEQISKNVEMKKEAKSFIKNIDEKSKRLNSSDIFPSIESEELFEQISQKQPSDLNSDDLVFLKDINSRVQYQEDMSKKTRFRIDINTGLGVNSNFTKGSVQCYNTTVGKILAKFGLAVPMSDNFGNVFYTNRKSILGAIASSNPQFAQLIAKDKEIKESFLTAFKQNLTLNVSDLKTISEGILKAEEQLRIKDMKNPGLAFVLSRSVNLDIYSSLAMEGLNRETIRSNDELDFINEAMTPQTNEDDDLLRELDQITEGIQNQEIDDEIAALEKEIELEDIGSYKTVREVVGEVLGKLSPPSDEELEKELASLIQQSAESDQELREFFDTKNLSVDEIRYQDELKALQAEMQNADLPENVSPIDMELFTNSEIAVDLNIGSMESYLKNTGDYMIASTDTPNQYILFTKDGVGTLVSRTLEMLSDGRVSIDGQTRYNSFNSAMVDLELENSIDPLNS